MKKLFKIICLFIYDISPFSLARPDFVESRRFSAFATGEECPQIHFFSFPFVGTKELFDFFQPSFHKFSLA